MLRLTVCILVAIGCCLLATPAHSQIPDPGQSDTPTWVSLSPGKTFLGNPIGSYPITVRDAAGNPLAGVLVRVTISAAARSTICFCSNQATVQTKATDANGEIVFTFNGGGCLLPAVVADPLLVEADNGGTWLTLGTAQMNSPDVVDNQGRMPPGPYNPGPPCQVGLSDGVFCTMAISMGLNEVCCKFTPPFTDPVGLGDAVALTPYVANASFCN